MSRMSSAEKLELEEFWNATAMQIIQNKKSAFAELLDDWTYISQAHLFNLKSQRKLFSREEVLNNYDELIDAAYLTNLMKMDYANANIQRRLLGNDEYSFSVQKKDNAGVFKSERKTYLALKFIKSKGKYKLSSIWIEFNT
ncbi:MAG: hypothetical protein ACRCYO_17960 [Bacteroidia bacterium]